MDENKLEEKVKQLRNPNEYIKFVEETCGFKLYYWQKIILKLSWKNNKHVK